jgi:hypothetical protein
MFGKPALYHALWAYVIATQAPRDGTEGADMIVDINPAMLAAMFAAKETEVRKAIEYLCSKDNDSRTKDESGRRLIREGQFTYKVVNGRKYRDMAGRERRREINRQAARRYRAKRLGAMAGERAFVKAVEDAVDEKAEVP